MPEFESYVNVDVDDFLSACSKREIENLIEYLIVDGYLSPTVKVKKNQLKSLMEEEWDEIVYKLSNSRLILTNEEEEIIRNIVKRF